MNLYPIPFDFIDKSAHLSWCDIKWGCENNLITSDVPIKKAEKNVLTGSYTNPELELSFVILGEVNHVSPFLKELCSELELKDDQMTKKKWLFIVLSWLWNNRNSFEDPLAEVEKIYADFDYPSEIEGFIKYMPPSDGYDPSKHSHMENINHLMDKWKNYLEKEVAVIKS
ncbi:DUF2247 family protein [Erwinia sp. V90_4]|jgi:hypothetical protein|uniref:DUF2247 family protein n=1 Tax=Erwinia sp. V90_4 TaxID=3044239 RepID=UPI000C17F0CA|nr:DUF2247 family protein [Erwinia sp. V90_4]MDI3438735.1 DUF2247 family protein [Erwinia sp. V90_4]PIJ49466.1 hypothetical protein BOM23_23680 [Erwinia sp. OLMDLW33]